MKKEYNKWLIILGVLFFIGWIIFAVSNIYNLLSIFLILLGIILISAGIVNYTKWSFWFKMVAFVILGAILYFFIFVVGFIFFGSQ